jgi:hypothetical protein
MSEREPSISKVATGMAQAQLRAQVIEASKREPSATRAELGKQRRIVLSVVVLVPLLVFIGCGGVRVGPRSDGLVLQSVLGSTVLAAVFAVVGIGRGRSMLGRPRAWLLAQVVLAPVLLFGWRVLLSSREPNMMAQWLDRPGFRCLALSLTLALAPLLGLLWLRRGSDPVHPRLTGAAMGAGVGAAAWVLVDLWCPVGYVPHLLLGHVLPLVLSVALSAVLGKRVLAVSKSPFALARH